uniref:Uncharacterized protein n=1 Tax=Anguilla anguilla TaxID=7936 RepID=A0A0E9UPX5_ANGAN
MNLLLFFHRNIFKNKSKNNLRQVL